MTYRKYLLLLILFIAPHVHAQQTQTYDLSCSYNDRIKQLSCLADQAAIGATHSNPSSKTKMRKYPYYFTVEAMNLIQNLISSARYSFIKKNHTALLAEKNIDFFLDYGIGICGHQNQLFQKLLQTIGLETRPIQFYYHSPNGTPLSHIASEVKIDNQWHYIDVTWGTFFVKNEHDVTTIASLSDILSHQKLIKITNQAALWYQHALNFNTDPLDYLSQKNVDIIIDNAGIIHLQTLQKNKSFRVIFKDIPNYVGKYHSTTPYQGIVYKLKLPNGIYKSYLKISFLGNCDDENLLCINNQCRQPSINENVFTVKNPSMIYIKNNRGECYAVFDNINFEFHNK